MLELPGGKVEELGYPEGRVLLQEPPFCERVSAGMGAVKIGVAVTAAPWGTTIRSAWMLSEFVLNAPFEPTVMVPLEAPSWDWSGTGNWLRGMA
jgi:hypothetical protein